MCTVGHEFLHFRELIRLEKAIFEKSCNFVLENTQLLKKKLVI